MSGGGVGGGLSGGNGGGKKPSLRKYRTTKPYTPACGWAQRGGIDRVLTLACGRVYTVDEKVRTNDWPDILLEQWSDEARRIPGWVQKPLACDFIAYAFAPSRRCYLLPVALLQRAWRMNGRRWIGAYGQRRARNTSWVSTSIPIAIDALRLAIMEAMLVGPEA